MDWLLISLFGLLTIGVIFNLTVLVFNCINYAHMQEIYKNVRLLKDLKIGQISNKNE